MAVNTEIVFAVMDAIKEFGIQVVPAFDGGTRIAIVRDGADTMTQGGLHIPDAGQRKKKIGTIVASSDTGVDAQAPLAPLRRVAFASYAGVINSVPTELGNIEVAIVHCSEIYMSWEAQEIAIPSWDATESAQLTEE